MARFVVSAIPGFLIDISAFYIFYHNLLTRKTYHIINADVSNHALSFSISYFMGVVINFIMTRYVVFSESKLAPYKQFIRFVSVAVIGYFANLSVIEFLVKDMNMYPPLARPTAALSLFIASYFIHRVFSFSLSLRHHAVSTDHKHGN